MLGGAVRVTPDAVIAALYEAATDASLWPNALASLTGLFTPAFTSHFFVADGKEISFAAVGHDYLENANAAYAAHYGHIDPRAALIASWDTGATFTCHQLFDDDYVARSEFYQDFLIPIGGRYIVATKLMDSGTRKIITSVHRNEQQGPFEAEDCKLYARLKPHLMQAARLFDRLSALRVAQECASAALDRLPWSMLIVDRNGKILQTNASAEALLKRGDVLKSKNGRLEVVAIGQPSVLRNLIFDAASAAGGRACVPGGSIRLDRSRDGSYLTLIIAPLRKATHQLSNVTSSGAIIFIADSAEQRVPPGAFLQKLYGLTPAEAAIAVAIAAGRTLDEISAMNGVTRNTVRVQTQSILSKTGVRRQAELVRLLLSIPTTS